MTRAICALVAMACTATSVSAAIVYRGFDNNPSGTVPMASTPNTDAARGDFLAALSAPILNNLESIAPGTGAAIVPFGPGLTMTADGAAFEVRDTPFNSAHGTQGPRYMYTEAPENSNLLTLTFSSPIRAIGFTFTDASDWVNTGQNPPHLLVTVGNEPGVSLITTLNTNQIFDGSTGFFGYVADGPFTTITIFRPIGGGATDAVGFDGFIVPAPSSLALVSLAAAARRSRRR